MPYIDQDYRGLPYRGKVRWPGLIDQYRVNPVELGPKVFLTANDSRMEFTLGYAVGYEKRRITKDLLHTRLPDEIDGTKGRMASTTFHLVETPEIKITLAELTKGGGA